jgi:hypothetical protein
MSCDSLLKEAVALAQVKEIFEIQRCLDLTLKEAQTALFKDPVRTAQ